MKRLAIALLIVNLNSPIGNKLAAVCFLNLSLPFLAQYAVSVERPCPMETVTFTCTVTGSSVRWVPSDVSRITLLNSSVINEPLMPQPGYTVTQIAFTDTTITSILSRTAEDGITVSCLATTPTITTIGSTTIDLVGELLSS